MQHFIAPWALGIIGMVAVAGCSGAGGPEQSEDVQSPVSAEPSSSAAAPAGSDRPQHFGKFQHGPKDPAAFIARFDANKDGKLELAELPEKARERFGAADTNRDGALDTAEIQASFAAMRAKFEEKAKARFAEKDANHDGVLDASEVGAERWQKMSAADANGDQKLTAEELKAAFESGKIGRGFGKHWRGHGHGDAPREAPAAPQE